MCPFDRFVLGVRELGVATARVEVSPIESSRDSVDLLFDSESPNYPCCILYSPLLLRYCRKMYEKRYDTWSYLLPECSHATRDVVISLSLVFALQAETLPDPPAAASDNPD